MLVRDDLSVQRSDGDHRRRSSFGLLDEDHAKCNQRPLANKIDTVLSHRFQNLYGVLEASASACDTEGEGRATSYVGVITFTEQLDDPWDLTGVLEEKEGKRSDSCASDII